MTKTRDNYIKLIESVKQSESCLKLMLLIPSSIDDLILNSVNSLLEENLSIKIEFGCSEDMCDIMSLKYKNNNRMKFIQEYYN